MQTTATDYTGICYHCKQKLKTDKEKEQRYCEECWGKYTDEMDAIYGGAEDKK